MEGLDRKRISRALGLAIKEAERSAMCPAKNSVTVPDCPEKIDRARAWRSGGHARNRFFRISYAVKMKPDELTERFEEIEKNIVQGVIHHE